MDLISNTEELKDPNQRHDFRKQKTKRESVLRSIDQFMP
jgi:hypothetical protein